MQTIVRKLRSDSRGLEGTYHNAEHHAENLVPMIDFLEKKVMGLGFAEWRQGNNVHVLVTTTGMMLTLRGIIKDNTYIGIRLSLRLSRSKEVRLYDAINLKDCALMVKMMGALAEPMKAGPHSLMCREAA